MTTNPFNLYIYLLLKKFNKFNVYMSQLEPFEHQYNNQYLEAFGCYH